MHNTNDIVKELKEIDLDNYVVSEQGLNAIIYNNRNNDNEILKLCASRIEKQTVIDEYCSAKQVYDLGVKSPKPYGLVKFNNRYGITFEKIKNKISLADAISNDSSKVLELTKLFASETRKIHKIVITNTSNVLDYDKFIRGLVSKTNVVDEEAKTLLLKLLDKTKKTKTFLHGDLHLGNILLADGELYWIDLGKFAFGNPLFDLGGFAFPAVVVADLPITKEAIHIDYETFKKIWPAFIKEYFNCGDDKVNYYTNIIICYSLYYHIYMCDVWHKNILSKEKYDFLINQIKKILPTL